jgi:predicted glutamine amidotransferase
MCGVAGYVGLGHLPESQRFDLVEALGLGIDSRGGDAAGFVVVNGPPHKPIVRLARKLDEWSDARGRFVRAAASGHTVMMHARWTTSGNAKDIECAHPYPIKRRFGNVERTVLYGAHNGMLDGTEQSAKAFGRQHSVDSREFLELLADKQYVAIKELEGYGVVTYVKPGDGIIRVVRISESSDFEIVAVEGGGMVYASTNDILADALDFADLKPVRRLAVSDIGKVYRLEPQKVRYSGLSGVRVQSSWWKGYGSNSCGLDDSGYTSYLDEAYGRNIDTSNWRWTYKQVTDEHGRTRWMKVSIETGEVLEETGFVDPQLPLTVDAEDVPESDSIVPTSSDDSEAVRDQRSTEKQWRIAADATAPESEPDYMYNMVPSDFDHEQAAEWEQFWKDNQHLLNDRSRKG